MRKEASKINFDFDSIEQKQFKNQGVAYKSKNLIVTFKNSMEDGESDVLLKKKYKSIENSALKR